MGLRALDLENWFESDGEAAAQCLEKQRLLDTRLNEVFVALDECRPAAEELATLVSRFVGTPFLLDDEHPLVATARLVADDLCIMEQRDGQWRLTGAVVAFPSRWHLASKLGQSLDGIHDVVPGYESQLATPVNAFFDRMTPERSFWRLNWTLLDSEELFLPPRVSIRDAVPSEWYFRVERQTLRQLPVTKAIIFTIRTYVTSLTDLLASDPNHGPALWTALTTAPDETKQYKGWGDVTDLLRDRLTN
jgi:hypothetical protein